MRGGLWRSACRRTRVRVGGNLKFDLRPPRSTGLIEQLRRQLPPGAKVLVAGSTLEDEEQVLLEAWPVICGRVPNAVMVLAPRHPERFARVAALARERKLLLVERSGWHGGAVAAGSVFLLDSIGELGSVYGLATLAFVGGSLVPAGGHNPLEPARFAVPVLMGSALRELSRCCRAPAWRGGAAFSRAGKCGKRNRDSACRCAVRRPRWGLAAKRSLRSRRERRDELWMRCCGCLRRATLEAVVWPLHAAGAAVWGGADAE